MDGAKLSIWRDASKSVRWPAGRVSMGSAMTPESQRRVGRGFRAVVLAVPVGLAIWWLSTRPERVSSQFEQALDARLAPVMQRSEASHKLGAATSTHARLLARELAQRSVPYLDARDLELWAATRLRVARASKPACARLWKGGGDAFLGPAIVALGPEALDAYVEMLARAFAVRLERKPAPAVPPDAFDRGFAAIAEQLAAGERERFEADVKRRDLSDERACELFLTLASGAEKLAPAARADFYRALAAAREVSSG
jgi:hypothetical protein